LAAKGTANAYAFGGANDAKLAAKGTANA